MEQDQVNYEYQRMKNPLDDTTSAGFSIFNFIFNAILISVAIGVGIWFIGKVAEIGGGAWWLVVIAVVMGLIITANNITAASAKQQFFDNPDNHTHDDECETCGKVYGPPRAMSYMPSYVYRMAYVCRHASGKMDYPR